jgi:hypothetical protein
MRSDHRRIVELIAMEIYHKFPDRKDRRLSIGDNTPQTGNCSGHPSGSHSGCDVMDINYYTLGETNTTHYRPGNSGDACNKLISIWRGDGWVGNNPDNLLIDLFDWERNYVIIKRIAELFPDSYFMINTCIGNYIYSKVKNLYGYNEAIKFINRVNTDNIPTYNHHIHCHIALRMQLNL